MARIKSGQWLQNPNDIYNMKLHQTLKVSKGIHLTTITAVPGGWIYKFWNSSKCTQCGDLCDKLALIHEACEECGNSMCKEKVESWKYINSIFVANDRLDRRAL